MPTLWRWESVFGNSPATDAPREPLEETVRRLLPAVADMAWWYGWSVQSVYDLELEEFDAFLKEAARQMKAGYRKGA